MHSERPRARRYPLVAYIEIRDVDSEAEIRGQTSNISLFGCSFKTKELLPKGTLVRVRIVHGGMAFSAQGRVAFAGQSAGIGVAFTRIEPHLQSVLETWISQLRG